MSSEGARGGLLVAQTLKTRFGRVSPTLLVAPMAITAENLATKYEVSREVRYVCNGQPTAMATGK